MDLTQINLELSKKDPIEIIRWGLQNAGTRAICSTNFRPFETVILHMVTQIKPDIQILWADSGCFLQETYRFAEKVITLLNLNIKIYNPLLTEARRVALHGEIPSLDNKSQHDLFTRQVKLEPFERGLKELNPTVWFTAIRKDQTEFRNTLFIITRANDSLLRIAPLFYWKESDLADYIKLHNLPNEMLYFDPTKVDEKRECGLHTAKL